MQNSKVQVKSKNLLFEPFDFAQGKLSRELKSINFSIPLLSAGRQGRYTRRIISSVVVVFLLFFLSLKPAVAHVLKVDGTIGVTIHIDPDDAPVANTQSTIFAVIKDTSGRFDEKKPGTCNCTLSIQQNGKELAKLPIATDNTYNTMQYVFPKAGTYSLVVDGTPKKHGAFQPFHLIFEYYAASSGAPISLDNTNKLSVYSPYIILAIGILILFMFLNPFVKRS